MGNNKVEQPYISISSTQNPLSVTLALQANIYRAENLQKINENFRAAWDRDKELRDELPLPKVSKVPGKE